MTGWYLTITHSLEHRICLGPWKDDIFFYGRFKLGVFQVPINNEDKELLAFTTVQGLFTFNRLPQGFKNSSAVFQRIINKIFSEHLYKKIVCFSDNLCIFGKTFEYNLENLNIIFKLLKDNNLSLKSNKCKFL